MVVLLLAISAHEAAHAWMSYKFGDDTARLLGRITLNPVAHTDPIGTLLIPIVTFIFGSAGLFIPLIGRSEEHTSELQSQSNLVCRLLLEKKKKKQIIND